MSSLFYQNMFLTALKPYPLHSTTLNTQSSSHTTADCATSLAAKKPLPALSTKFPRGFPYISNPLLILQQLQVGVTHSSIQPGPKNRKNVPLIRTFRWDFDSLNSFISPTDRVHREVWIRRWYTAGGVVSDLGGLSVIGRD